MITRRTFLSSLWIGALAPAFAAFAQQPKVRRIGFLALRSRSTPSNPDPYYDAFVRGMRELGYVEGKNLVTEWRFADGKYGRLPALAAELVQMKVEVIVTQGPGTQALQRVTSTIPIVFVAVNDPVGSGVVANLARPGGNVTGLSLMAVDLSPKHLELLKTMMPRLSSVAVLVNFGNAGHPAILKSVQAAAHQVGIEVLPVNARAPEEI